MSAPQGNKSAPAAPKPGKSTELIALEVKVRQQDAEIKSMTQWRDDQVKKSAAAAAKAIEDKVDEKIATGHIDLGDNADQARQDAIHMFTHSPAQAERLYAKQLIPVGEAKRRASGEKPPAPVALTVEQQVSALSNDQQAVYLALSTFRTPQEALKATLARTASS